MRPIWLIPVIVGSIFLVLMTAYIALGLGETVLLLRRRFIEIRQEKLAQAAAASSSPPPADPATATDAPPRDEEVLRELGAFDDTTEGN